MLSFRRVALLALLTPSLVWAAKGGGKDRSIGAGLAFPDANQAANVNPSLFHEGGPVTVQGLWQFEANAPMASVASGHGSVGFGANWTHAGSANHLAAGFSAQAGGAFSLGAALKTTDFSGFDADLGFTTELSNFRLALIARGLSGGLDRIDVGLGFVLGQLLLGVDAKKSLPIDEGGWNFDVTLGVTEGKLGAAIGLDLSTGSANRNGNSSTSANLHAGVAYEVASQVALEAHYRYLPHEVGAADFTLGARAKF